MPINKKITKAVVDAAVYDGAVRPLPNGRTAYGRHVIWDTEIKGFGVRVNPGGTKTYVYSYRNKWGKPRLKTIGKHGNITAEQARRMAKREAAAVVDGDDPLAERQAARNAPTVAEYFEAHYFKLHAVPGKLEAKTVQEQRYAIDKHVVSRFGDLPLPALGPEHVSRMHAEMAATPYAANRTLIYLSGALNLAERWGLRPEGSNPCADVTKYPEKGRKRTAGKDELARLAAALRTMEERAPLSPRANHRLYRQTAVAAIRLWLLTGARRGQVLKAKRTDYDRARGILWVEPKSRAKKQRGEKQPIPLSRAAAAVLDGLIAADSTSEYLIPGRSDDAPRRDLKKPWQEACALAELKGLTIHDLRRTYATQAAGAEGIWITQQLLGHADISTTARSYAHVEATPHRDAAERVSESMAALMGAPAPSRSRAEAIKAAAATIATAEPGSAEFDEALAALVTLRAAASD